MGPWCVQKWGRESQFSKNTGFRSVSSLLCEAELSRDTRCFSELRFRAWTLPGSGTFRKKRTRQKGGSNESTCVALLCFLFDSPSPSPNSSVKNRVFCRRSFSSRTFSLKIGFAPKRPFDNFPLGQKNRTFSVTASLGPQIRAFGFRKKNGRNH